MGYRRMTREELEQMAVEMTEDWHRRHYVEAALEKFKLENRWLRRAEEAEVCREAIRHARHALENGDETLAQLWLRTSLPEEHPDRYDPALLRGTEAPRWTRGDTIKGDEDG